jgi:hypothetical protein
MTTAAQSACCCEHVTLEVTQCPEHYRLWRGGKRLKSVGSIIRESFPGEPCTYMFRDDWKCLGVGYSNHDETCPIGKAVKNAMHRGKEVDKLFAEYVRGGLRRIPAGTREDAAALFLKLQKWYDAQNFTTIAVQYILGDTDHGGVVDFIFDGVPVDLKCTYNIEHTSRLQVAAYSDLCLYPLHGLILHVTGRFDAPKLVELRKQDVDDWRMLLDCWRMVKRRAA